MKIRFEEVKEGHLNSIMDIYNYYVETSTATFQISKLNIDEIREQVIFKEPRYRTYVILDQENDDQLCGYVSLAQHKKREAFNITGEIALYLDQEYTNKGIGSKAIKYIEAVAIENKFHSLISTITTENEGSIRLFQKMGYEQCANYKEVGKKFNKLLGVVSFQKIL